MVLKAIRCHLYFRGKSEQRQYLFLSDIETYERRPELLFGTTLQQKKVSGQRQNLESLFSNRSDQ